ncbi:MAG: aminotransferase class III-fold pyridoxal phosphate-dependent enzyme, partial [Gemmatales bacterium]|nr:aminotransferase class III-fold pyridoxal phosphate-dependent enzyme [Gemmatales bacterium]MDW8176582.1 aminotransferase class III-fold pyridoxal phosphate-dependent enzyme [Gemmatales bacterium]
LREGLLRLQNRFPHLIARVRGLGLMVALDVLREGQLSTALRDEVVQTAFRRGLLLLGCGDAAVRFCPPLCVTSEQVQLAVQLLAEVFQEVTSRRHLCTWVS